MRNNKQYAPSCEISNELINSKLTRLYAIITFSIVLLFSLSPYKWIIYISATDFAIRVFLGVKMSPICNLLQIYLSVSHTPTHMVNAGPKKFAGRIGFAFTILMSVFHIVGWTILANGVAYFSLAAIGLEAFAGFCVACFMHQQWQKLKNRKQFN
ncbi:MAG: DUF4395 domain-containing protein [Bacteroidales bacterium]|nr:DUF4395 domain-containing protein [Bacteroidales bacterium]